MLQFLQQCGPFAIPLILILLTIIFLTLRAATVLSRTDTPNVHAYQRSVNAILFWGIFSVILGVLVKFSALYKIFSVVSTAEIISPRNIAMGLKESLTSTLFGMTLLLISGVTWFILMSRRPQE